MAPYTYQPLKAPDEIRLLSLLPHKQDPNKPIECRFQHVRLVDQPQYEALSYTWGDQQVQHPVTVDTTGKEVSVGRNCLSALRCLRRAEEPRLLWIDALCINQADNKEKASQVPIMGDIYTCARETIILLQYAGPDETYHGKGAGPELQRCWDSGSVGQGSGPPALDEAAKEELFNIDNYPWFHRSWIIQETLLSFSKRVVCPPFEWTWDGFTGLVPDGSETDIVRMNDDYWINKGNGGGWNHVWHGQLGEKNAGDMSPSQALGFLVDTREFKCSVPNDRVFSILSLFHPPLPIPVDYAHSKEMLCEHLTGALIDVGESRFWYSTHRESWRVDWEEAPKDLVGPDIRYLALMRSMLFAKAEAQWSRVGYIPGYSGQPGYIRSLSFRIGEVKRISQATFDSGREDLKQQWGDIMTELGLPVDARESGAHPIIHIQRRNRSNVPWYHAWVGDKDDDTDDNTVGGQDGKGKRKSHGTSAAFLHDRPVFVCGNDGLIGVGTQDLRVGDEIWYVCGLNAPVCALRRTSKPDTVEESVSPDGMDGIQATMVGLCFLRPNSDLKAIRPLESPFPYGGPELVYIV